MSSRSEDSQGHSASGLVEQVVKPVMHLGHSLTAMFGVLGLGSHLGCAKGKSRKGERALLIQAGL